MRYYLYVDNLGVFGMVQAEVTQALEDGTAKLGSANLTTHEHRLSGACCEALGVEIDGQFLTASLTEKRYWKLDRGIAWLLRRGRCTGIMLEVFLGHFVFAAMLVRSSLSCFHSCYRFVQAHYGEDILMWSSVFCEIRTFKGLLPPLHCNWRSPWSGFVTFTDASEYGWGIVSGHLDPEVVARHGRVKERSCWKCGAELAPRRTALENMQKVTTPMPNGSSLPREAPTPVGEAEFANLVAADGSPTGDVNERFPELDDSILNPGPYKVAKYDRWTDAEDIFLGESRALLFGMRRAAGTRPGKLRRLLFIVDNMAVCLAFSKGRSRRFDVLVQIRKWCAYMLARGILPSIRWTPTEWNWADLPSRFFQPNGPRYWHPSPLSAVVQAPVLALESFKKHSEVDNLPNQPIPISIADALDRQERQVLSLSELLLNPTSSRLEGDSKCAAAKPVSIFDALQDDFRVAGKSTCFGKIG